MCPPCTRQAPGQVCRAKQSYGRGLEGGASRQEAQHTWHSRPWGRRGLEQEPLPTRPGEQQTASLST